MENKDINENNDDVDGILEDIASDDSGFIDVVYREMWTNHMTAMMELQSKGETDTKSLLKVMNTFPETRFSAYISAEAPVLRKDERRARQLREQGNKAYLARRNQEALELYTRSVRFAPYKGTGQGEQLGLALANRSAVLVSMKEHRLALQDISLALNAGYPPDLAYKLHDRRAKCMKELGDYKKAEISVQDCKESLKEAKMEEAKRLKFEENLIKFAEDLPKRSSIEINDLEFSDDLPTLKCPNKDFPAFSDAVEVRYDVDRGRYGVAARDIALGELLCVERPPVFFLHEETSGINCSHCFRESKASLPSPTCTQTVFCSRFCQTEAMATYHQVESKFMDVLFQHGLKKKEWFLALRAVTLKPLSYFIANREMLENLRPEFGVSGQQKDSYRSEDLSSLCNLVSHHDKWDWRDHAYKAFFALFFVRCLQKAGYFGEKSSDADELSEEELLIGSFMTHIMEVATMNSHEIGQMEADKDQSWLVGQVIPVGCALEPTLVLLNHACDPSMLRVNIGTSTVGFASRKINKGDEITDCYSWAYDVTPMTERNPDLKKKYKFQCDCIACKEKWSTFHELPRSFNDVPEHKLNFSPEELPQIQGKMMKIQKLGAQINQLQQKEDFVGAMDLYGEFYDAVQQVVAPPHQFYVMARRSYATCLWVKYGNQIRRGL